MGRPKRQPSIRVDEHPWRRIWRALQAVNETFFRRGRHPERGGYEKIIKEATQVAALAVAIVESAMCAVDLREGLPDEG